MDGPPPPPPPPHGANPNTTEGNERYRKSTDLPEGNYDIFVIPPHSAGSGFIYLPSLQCHRNSFIAGSLSTLLAVVVWVAILPTVKSWFATTVATGGMGIIVLVIGVGAAGWFWGVSQTEGGTNGRRPPRGPRPGGFEPEPQFNPGQNFGGNFAGGGPTPGAQYPRGQYNAGNPPPQQPPPGPPPHNNTNSNNNKANTANNTSNASSGSASNHGTNKPESEWERAREETKRKEEIRRKMEEYKRKRQAEELEKQRQRDREAMERELQERKAQLEREAAAAKEAAEKERLARDKAEKEAAEKEAAMKEAARKEAAARFAAAKDAAAKKFAAAKEAAAKEAATKEAATKEAAANATPKIPASAPSAAPPRTPSPKKPQQPTAKTAAEDDAYSFRPYDRPRRPYGQSASSVYSESSYAPSQSTARTTPPPSTRGAYFTKDPDKVIIRGVYAFNNAFMKTPIAQLVSGKGSVTDGLVLRITTEGLFIDDDVRGVAQREWDVKAWTMKLVEVWCPSLKAHFPRKPLPQASSFRRGTSRSDLGAEDADAFLDDLLEVCRNTCQLAPPSACFSQGGSCIDGDHCSLQTAELRGLHVVRASLRDQEGKKYVFVLQETEGWKVAIGLQRLRRGSQVRALNIAGMPANESKALLSNLGYIS